MLDHQHLFTLDVALAPMLDIGQGPNGYRRIIPITGGRFDGRISGEILPGGADWNLVRPDGTVHIVGALYPAHRRWRLDHDHERRLSTRHPRDGFVANFDVGPAKPLDTLTYAARAANWAKGQSPGVN
jgi:hypothetical protein